MQGSDLHALVALFRDEDNKDISYQVTQAVKLLNRAATVNFWGGFVLSSPAHYNRLNTQALTNAMFAMCRYCMHHDSLLKLA